MFIVVGLNTMSKPARGNGGPGLACWPGAKRLRLVMDEAPAGGRRRATTEGGIWTNRAEAHGQLVLSPVRLPEQLRSSRLVDLAQIVVSRGAGPDVYFLFKTESEAEKNNC